MTERIEVANVSDFEEGDRKFVNVNDKRVGVIRHDGEFFAIDNRCVHQDGPICSGKILPIVEAEWEGLGERITEFETDDLAISCPYHGWEYDLETGEHLGDSDYGVDTYPVDIDDGTVYLEVD